MDLYALTKTDVDKQRVVNGIVLTTPRGEPFPENEGRVSARVPPHRLVQITEEVTAATYSGESPTALGSGKGSFRIARSDGSSIGSVEDEEYDILSLDTSTHAVGKTLLVYRMQDLAGDQYAEPGWVIPKQAATNDVPSIDVGMNGTASAENSFATASTTYDIAWSADETVNSDTDVFGQTNQDPVGVYTDILCKVAGTYRVFYHCEFTATTTHTASQIQRARTYVVSKAGGVGADTEISRSSCTADMLSIDADDMDVGLGSMRVHASGETLVELDANDTVRVKFEYQSGDRGYDCVGESFGAQLVKRG